jgi:hypothetical protein
LTKQASALLVDYPTIFSSTHTQPEQPKEEQKPKFVEKMKQVKEPDADGKRWKE